MQKKSNILARAVRFVYRKIQRKRLKVHDFSIITNTCVGGVIYHELGVKFQTPTINLGMCDKDFFKFLANIHEYLSYDFRFVDEGYPYPTAYLNDIFVEFVHYKTNEEANTKWKERIPRINWDKIYIICSDRPHAEKIVTHEDMLSLKDFRCLDKVIFSTREYDDIDYIVHLPKDPEGDFVNIYMEDKLPIINFWRWEFKWDYVKWINNGGSKKK